MAARTPLPDRSRRAGSLHFWLAAGFFYAGVAVAGWTLYGVGALDFSMTAAASSAAVSLALLLGSALVLLRAPAEQRARMARLIRAGERTAHRPGQTLRGASHASRWHVEHDPLESLRRDDDLARLGSSYDDDPRSGSI